MRSLYQTLAKTTISLAMLTTSAVAKPTICRQALPTIDDPMFGISLYKRVKACPDGTAVEAYVDDGVRVVFKDKGVRYTLQIGPHWMDVHFRRDGTHGDKSRGFIADGALLSEDQIPYKTSLDGICEMAGLVDADNGLFKEPEVPIDVQYNVTLTGENSSDIGTNLFVYWNNNSTNNTSRYNAFDDKEQPAFKQRHDFAQKVCRTVLSRIRDFYNRKARFRRQR